MTNKEKPVFGTTEWAASNVNIIKGCSNDCKYCFSKEMAIRFKRKTPDNWKQEEVNLVYSNYTARMNDKVSQFDGEDDLFRTVEELVIRKLNELKDTGA